MILQACDDPFQPRWRTLARIDLAAGRVQADLDFPMLGQLREWVGEGMLVLEDDASGAVRAERLSPQDPRFRDQLERRLGFSMRLLDEPSAS